MEQYRRGSLQRRVDLAGQFRMDRLPARVGFRDVCPAEGFEKPIVVRSGRRRDRHIVPTAGVDRVAAEPAAIDPRLGRNDFIDRVGAGDNTENADFVTAHASADAVTSCRPQATGVPFTSPVNAAASAVTWPTTWSERAIGATPQKVLHPEERHRFGRIGLRPHVRERSARLGRICPYRAGETEAQPILARQHVPDLRETLAIGLLQPSQQGRRGRDVRLLARQIERFGEERAFRPSVENRAGAAVEG